MLPTSTPLTSIEIKPADKVSPLATMVPAFIDRTLYLQLSKSTEPGLARFGLSLPYGVSELGVSGSYNLDVNLFDPDVINFVANFDGKIQSAVNADPPAFFHHITPSAYVPMLRERDGIRFIRLKVPSTGEGVEVTRLLPDGTFAPATIHDIKANTPVTCMARHNGIYFTDKSYACSLKLSRVIIHCKPTIDAPDFV